MRHRERIKVALQRALLKRRVHQPHPGQGHGLMIHSLDVVMLGETLDAFKHTDGGLFISLAAQVKPGRTNVVSMMERNYDALFKTAQKLVVRKELSIFSCCSHRAFPLSPTWQLAQVICLPKTSLKA